MIVDIYPSTISGSITPPPSKSILHRAIISACMSRGLCKIHNVIYSDDILATMDAFTSLGVRFINYESYVEVDARHLNLEHSKVEVDCKESGSTIRFLIPLLSNDDFALFKGKSSLIKRPMDIYDEIFKRHGFTFYQDDNFIKTKGSLTPGNYVIKGDISSQFISGLMFKLPLLNADSTIEVVGNFESSEYVDITIDVLKAFGIKIIKDNNLFLIPGNQTYIANDYTVESDFSQLAFYAVLGIVNADLVIHQINHLSLQPDRRILNIISQMGGRISYFDDSILIKKSKTHSSVIDVSQCPDIAPIIGLLAACSEGESKIVNAKRLTMKESDRLKTTYETLKSFGVKVVIEDDSLTINGSPYLSGNEFDSFNDHRIAMMIAIGATVANEKVTINNAESINKSYPNFYKDLQSLGAIIEYR